MNFIILFCGGGGEWKNKFVWGYDEIMNILLTFGESFLYILGLFLAVKIHNWKMCLGLLNFKYLLGMLDISYILGGK